MPKKVALVIGNSEYKHLKGIPPAVRDAEAIAGFLREVGFHVMQNTFGKENMPYTLNMGRKEMRMLMYEFKELVREAELAFFYFSGHGVQHEGRGYLLPSDIEDLDDPENLPECSFSLSQFITSMVNVGDASKIFILDACRDNPFSLMETNRKGLAEVQVARRKGKLADTMIFYAADVNQAAYFDPRAPYSYFTEALLESIKEPLELGSIFRQVRRKVVERTKAAKLQDVQHPWLMDSSIRDIYLISPKPQTTPRPVPSEILPRAGERQVLTIKGVDFAFRYCPPGRFRMGDDSSSADWEKPAHDVEIPSGFWMGETPVTQAQFRVFVEATGYKTTAETAEQRGVHVWNGNEWKWDKGALWSNVFVGANRPVVGVSWLDTVAYTKWLNGLGLGSFRLPFEEEWEYACLAGSRGQYCFGDDESELGKYAWYDANSKHETHPVGEKLPNAWGLRDVHGNVWEWTNSEWTGNYEAFRGKVRVSKYSQAHFDKLTQNSNTDRVLRGGSWSNIPQNLRAANRYFSFPTNRHVSVGFRLAKTL
ncbi:MAG: SUMF1/EgtB/PvdO family nonheme iron enzyme [Bacteroidetes Order II. Incertae sedis bacterium]|nr:SUMF1/EgtB/PvdO family nonheme iron enzyme [Bacteroidetes Order II. bacterium]